MIQFTNKTDLVLVSGIANTKGDLARLNFIRGKLFAAGDLVSGSGHEINVILKQNGIQAAVATLNAANNWGASVDLDMSLFSSADSLKASVYTVSAGGVVNVSAWIEVEHPVVVSA